MATVFVIATPIGNLEDITLRALRVLKEVDLILCEDTRVTKKLLQHYDIETQTHSYNAHASDQKHDKILQTLEVGNDVALVSDAGTPSVSDPGMKIVSMVYQTLPDVSVVTIPGASALIAAISIAGLPVSEFTFLGFLPHKKGRQTLFQEIADSKRTIVFYESVHRIEKTLDTLNEVLDETREIVVARELTKLHEELVRGSAKSIAEYFTAHPEKCRGEFVVLVSGA